MERFGPFIDNEKQASSGLVLCVATVEDDEEAIALANDVECGLAAGLRTSVLKPAHSTAARLEAGNVWINTYRTTAPQAPFGGYKQSGLGCEGGQAAIEQFLETKAVWVDMNDDFPHPFVMRL